MGILQHLANNHCSGHPIAQLVETVVAALPLVNNSTCVTHREIAETFRQGSAAVEQVEAQSTASVDRIELIAYKCGKVEKLYIVFIDETKDGHCIRRHFLVPSEPDEQGNLEPTDERFTPDTDRNGRRFVQYLYRRGGAIETARVTENKRRPGPNEEQWPVLNVHNLPIPAKKDCDRRIPQSVMPESD